jgi:SAM-dependent methyltransferase
MASDVTITDRVLLAIFHRFPPRPADVIFREVPGRADSEYADEVKNPYFKWFESSEEMFRGKDVLDLGSGYGGRAVRFAECGAKSVKGVEVGANQVEAGRVFAEARGARNVSFAEGTGEAIPFADGSFDLIACYDVLEHVFHPADVIRECWRVLRPGGRFTVVFPPYYHVLGGSHLHGYATSFPGLNIVFSTRALRSATRHLLEERGVDYRAYLRDVPTDKLWNQNGLTVRGFHALVAHSPFRIERSQCVGQPSRYFGFVPTPPLRQPLQWAIEAAANVPVVREAFCSRVVASLVRD